jgi:hypothetical protein
VPAEPAPPAPTPEEIDINRHREITSKAVSAILILLLKWFKASRTFLTPTTSRFFRTDVRRYQRSLLCPITVRLKLSLAGAQDVRTLRCRCCCAIEERVRGPQVIRVTGQVQNTYVSFFRYCHLHCSRSPPGPEDEVLRPPKPANKTTTEGEQETEVIFDYSWRNFFSTINFLKVLQKMTKHRTHRTYMMTQYKSSVSFLSPFPTIS